MSKTVLFLADGMADEPLPELGGKTPLEHAATPNMDAIARAGASGTFLALPEGFPTSSDVANLSVMGYDLATNLIGRGPLEALSQGITLGPEDIAFRCNLITTKDGVITDYSAGHIDNETARVLISELADEFNSPEVSFHPGVSYRNLLILHGARFSDRVLYEKPDASHGKRVADLLPKPVGDDPRSVATAKLLCDLIARSQPFLEQLAQNAGRESPANLIWPWSPGGQPKLQSFAAKYGGVRAAVISAVDVIFGLGAATGMDLIRVPGATGFVDTNYEGKADAAVAALADHDFVYLHVEAIDECGHLGDLKLKLKAIEDFDARVVGRVMNQLRGQPVTFAVLPDHPVPVKQRIHTRVPVPVAMCGPHIRPDQCQVYGEQTAPTGALGLMRGDQLMRRILNLP